MTVHRQNGKIAVAVVENMLWSFVCSFASCCCFFAVVSSLLMMMSSRNRYFGFCARLPLGGEGVVGLLRTGRR